MYLFNKIFLLRQMVVKHIKFVYLVSFIKLKFWCQINTTHNFYLNRESNGV